MEPKVNDNDKHHLTFANTKVLIGCPTHESMKYALRHYLEGVKKIDYNYELIIADNSETGDYAKYIKAMMDELGIKGRVIKDAWMERPKDRLVHSRNLIREIFLKEKFDYFLSLEQDVAIEPGDLKKLLAHKKEVVAALVINYIDSPSGKRMLVPMIYMPVEQEGKMRYITTKEMESGKLLEIKASHLACTLIHKDILEKIAFRYERAFDDVIFCRDTIKNGFKVYCDTSIRPMHMKKQSSLKTAYV